MGDYNACFFCANQRELPRILVVLVLGNIMIRLAYEGVFVMLKIWKNTTEISQKMNGVKKKSEK